MIINNLRIMEKNNLLEILIENCEFPKEFNYFLTIHEDGQGERVLIKKSIKLFYVNQQSYIEENRCICNNEKSKIH